MKVKSLFLITLILFNFLSGHDINDSFSDWFEFAQERACDLENLICDEEGFKRKEFFLVNLTETISDIKEILFHLNNLIKNPKFSINEELFSSIIENIDKRVEFAEDLFESHWNGEKSGWRLAWLILDSYGVIQIDRNIKMLKLPSHKYKQDCCLNSDEDLYDEQFNDYICSRYDKISEWIKIQKSEKVKKILKNFKKWIKNEYEKRRSKIDNKKQAADTIIILLKTSISELEKAKENLKDSENYEKNLKFFYQKLVQAIDILSNAYICNDIIFNNSADSELMSLGSDLSDSINSLKDLINNLINYNQVFDYKGRWYYIQWNIMGIYILESMKKTGIFTTKKGKVFIKNKQNGKIKRERRLSFNEENKDVFRRWINNIRCKELREYLLDRFNAASINLQEMYKLCGSPRSPSSPKSSFND